jgi:hypothetical protein
MATSPHDTERGQRAAEGPICADDPTPYTRVQPGQYPLRCISQKIEYVHMYRAWKCRLIFAFMDLETEGTVAKWFHLGRDREAPAIGRKSDYFQAWIMANDGQAPKRGCTMTARTFVDKIFLCVIEDVIRTSDPDIMHSEATRYSSVRKILKLVGP